MRKKNMMLVLVLLLIIGFASVTTTLVITGRVGISSKQSDFDVLFTKAILDDVEKNEFITGDKKQTINFTSNVLTKINETTTLEYEVANKSRLYDAEVNITCNLVNDKDETIRNDYVEMSYLPNTNKMTVLAGKSEKGSITAKLIKSSTEDQDIKVKCELTARATEREELGAEYKEPIVMPTGVELIADADNDGTLNVGDEIAIREEHFYVISNENGTINALAKFNLNVGSNLVEGATVGIQNELAKGYVESGTIYGNVKFSNDNGWPYENNATIDIRNDSHAEGPVKEALYGANGYEGYIQGILGDETATVRLIEKAELEKLGCSYNEAEYSGTCTSSEYEWTYSTSYWTQSADSGRGNGVWRVESDGYFSNGTFFDGSSCGVRPVVVISEV